MYKLGEAVTGRKRKVAIFLRWPSTAEEPASASKGANRKRGGVAVSYHSAATATRGVFTPDSIGKYGQRMAGRLCYVHIHLGETLQRRTYFLAELDQVQPETSQYVS